MQHITEFTEELVRQVKPADYHLSPESLERLALDNRIWPAVLWLRTPESPGRPSLLRQWQIYPDPCNPGDHPDPLVRNWRVRRMTGTDNLLHTVKECPEQLVAGCDASEPENCLILIYWEIDNKRKLRNGQKEAQQQDLLDLRRGEPGSKETSQVDLPQLRSGA